MTDLLLSIHPHYAEAILDGVKKLEFRRRFNPTAKNVWCYLYATAPIKRVIGKFFLPAVKKMPIPELWQYHQVTHGTNVCPQSFHQYFEGVTHGYALHAEMPERFEVPMPLKVFCGMTVPPRSYAILKNQEVIL